VSTEGDVNLDSRNDEDMEQLDIQFSTRHINQQIDAMIPY